jgi:hypothetical protein
MNATMDRLDVGFTILGWWDEWNLVYRATIRGGVVLASDIAHNLGTTGLLEGFTPKPKEGRQLVQAGKDVEGVNDKLKSTKKDNAEKSTNKSQTNAPRNKHLVSFVMSDGDNVQWMLNGWFQEKWYAVSEVGSLKNWLGNLRRISCTTY